MKKNGITHKELIKHAYRWLFKAYQGASSWGHRECKVIVSEIRADTWMSEIPDCIGFDGKISVLVECKTSKADFLKDKEKGCRLLEDMPLGNQRWFLAPQGVIETKELPPKWGLIEVRGEGTRVVKKAEYIENNKSGELNILISLIRRLKIKKEGHIGIKEFTEMDIFGKENKKDASFLAA